MVFPSNYTKEFLPIFSIKIISFLPILKMFIFNIFKLLGLSHLIDHSVQWPEPNPELKSISAMLIQEMLPATEYAVAGSILKKGSAHDQTVTDKDTDTESCAVCLYELREHETIRRLRNCKHVFHKGCIDRWMEHDQKNCPLCREPFVPRHLVDVFNQRLEAASKSFPEFGSEFSVINTFL